MLMSDMMEDINIEQIIKVSFGGNNPQHHHMLQQLSHSCLLIKCEKSHQKQIMKHKFMLKRLSTEAL